MPPTTNHQPDRIVTHNISFCYSTTSHSTSVYCFLVYSDYQSALLLERLTHWTSTNGERMKTKINDHEVTDLLKAMFVPVTPYGCVFFYSGGAQKSIKGIIIFLKWIRTELVEL
jgi:hypothetical protein